MTEAALANRIHLQLHRRDRKREREIEEGGKKERERDHQCLITSSYRRD